MAVVVIVLMIAFVGGSALNYLLSPKRTSGRQVVAYFGDNKKITSSDFALARWELDILKHLGVDGLIRSRGLRGFLLAELLFSEGKASLTSVSHVRQMIRANQYRISDKQIIDIYSRSMPGHVYWYCLKNEAQLVGIRIENDDARDLLGRAIPQLFEGQTYSQRMSPVMNRYGTPEAEILATFGKLLAVFQYSALISSTEDVTTSQLMHMASWENETINVEFVKFDSNVFAETEYQPSEDEMLKHFNRHKNFFAGDVNEANPCGFGYKLPDMIQMEYIAVKLDDVSQIVKQPTPEETEEFYQKYREQFTESIPQDPNDPNSPSIERTRSYAEVANIISKQLLQDKINSKAEGILQEARTLTDADQAEGLDRIKPASGGQDIEPENISIEQLKQKAGDYETAAKELAKKYKIKIYSGQTGLLSASDMQDDEYLRRLYVLSSGRNPVRLATIVFSIPDLIGDQLQADKSTSVELIDVQKPKIYENIDPVKDYLGQIMAVVRVTKAEKASEPESIDSILDNRSLMLDDDRESSIEHPVSRTVKEKVTQDLKKLVAMDNTKSKAEEFIDLVAKDSWQTTIDKFNQLYPDVHRQAGQEPNNPSFKLENLTALQRISSKLLETLAAQSAGNPAARLVVNRAKVNRQFIDQLYSLVPPDSNTVDSLPLVLEFKPDMSFYVIKDISVKRLEQQEYEKIKARHLLTEEYIQSESLAPVYFNPENILKRMRFRLAQIEESEESKEAP